MILIASTLYAFLTKNTRQHSREKYLSMEWLKSSNQDKFCFKRSYIRCYFTY